MLLLEDDDALREAFREALVEGGFDAVAMADGREVIRRFETLGPWDLLLFDEQLPGATGREVLAALRAKGVHTPALVCSGTLELNATERRALGVVSVLRKPVRLPELIAAVRGAAAELRRG